MVLAAVANPETVADKFAIGGNTALIGMGIVFMVLIALWLIIVIEHKIISGIQGAAKTETPVKEEVKVAETATPVVEKHGTSNGDTEISGDVDDETAAVILASVSEHTSIPMNELKIKSIKAL